MKGKPISKSKLVTASEAWRPIEFPRYWFLLKSLRRKGGAKTVRELKDELEAHDPGNAPGHRTIQRILDYFAEEMGLQSRTRSAPGSPKEWYWGGETGVPVLDEMDPPVALVYEMAGRLLGSLLPKKYLDEMKPRFGTARKVLNNVGGSKKLRVTEKIRVMPRSLARRPAAIDQQVLLDLYDALLNSKQVLVRYANLKDDSPDQEMVINPLGMVNRLDMMYLICAPENSPKKGTIKDLVVQRIKSTLVLECKANAPEGFDLDRYLDYPSFVRNPFPDLAKLGKTFRLKAIFKDFTAAYVKERPFGYEHFDDIEEKAFFCDQDMKQLPDGRWQVVATVKNTRELMTQLHDFAGDVEVVEPKLLRNYFKDLAENLTLKYQD